MSDLLKMAERLYEVAAYFRRDAEFTLQCVDMMERHADQMSEMHMKNETPPAEGKSDVK